MLKAWSEMIVACLREAPEARALAEHVLTHSMWQDPEGFVTNGLILSRLGSDELALRALRTAVDGGFHVPYMLLHDPWLAPLRSHARFGEIVRLAQARHAEAVAVFRIERGEQLLGLRAAA